MEHHRIVREALDRHGGFEVDTQGEAFFAAFGRAHLFRVRIGVHTGQPRIAETGYVGLDVPRAARICVAGHGGQVLLSGADEGSDVRGTGQAGLQGRSGDDDHADEGRDDALALGAETHPGQSF